ncbi:EAL domain-containing response regulator [Aliivibrio sifiae]|uniref:Response regulator n=1 Tax=Aliivibrio sifiae TaxID=566293 RepID=A0A2S7X9F0_9GAMM|nr:EAL domain-containing protein [Aliivibrio sifiae]PQJ87766.1 response regulator [Aliivibrio sifiae]GLR73398.1 hypothetical protein GCM10007855_02710 [Aliivibrio sifiae]
MKSNIIIVDDIEFSRKVISYIIKKRFNDEVNIIEAENSYDVEKIIKSNIKINGIITDIIMPDGSGFDLINVLSMNNYNIPIVIVSSVKMNILEKIMNLAEVSGVNIINSYRKPISSEDIIKSIENFSLQELEEKKECFTGCNKNSLVELYYQPQVNIQDRVTIGAEVFIQWKNKEDSSVSQNVFMPKIDDMKKLLNFMRLSVSMLFDEVCEYFDNMNDEFKLNLRVPLKIICDDEFIGYLLNRKLRIPSNKIVFVIDCHDKIDDRTKLVENTKMLKDIGIGVSINFCEQCNKTYISDAYKELPLARVTMDHNIPTSSRLHICNALSISDNGMVIYDVNNDGVKDKLIEQGLKFLQGDYLSPLMTSADINKWIENYESETSRV